ncbi:MAG: 2-amino-4-hydroxy-6-hydroxymethyldihydropteridine diphosphokinase [Planctomycetes bacterium GWF2_41_51]|nr:MAG: 2-amino-4-hydroxy-6-hydroxymethyldihydropteridine diphosphokinase [Planctomycetes bacterium GWF2_41_51]HBG27589.1 2-amino-4-hydroxy-6-hydroxymethyldihydropteridine diphosphokinase [Phycisphaerales bacterium]
MSGEVIAYVALGSNLGSRQKNINKALDEIASVKNINILRTSSVAESKPLADKKQNDYLDCVAQIKTNLPPDKLLKVLKKIEVKLGRKKTAKKWSSRTIDLDILLYGKKIVRKKDLVIPHPQMHLRSFVLKGLREIDSQIVHPVLKENVSLLYSRLKGKDFYIDENLPKLISVAGVIGAGKTTLAAGLRDVCNFHLIKEAYDTNPFLPKVYAGQKSFALDSQLYFLLSRCEQLKPENLKDAVAVSDYIMDKEMIYARVWLDAMQFELYSKINEVMTKMTVSPSVVIYLKSQPNGCLKRIKQRSRPYEKDIDLNFLENIHNGYEKLFDSFSRCPVITIDAETVDFRQKEQVEVLAKKINYYIGYNKKCRLQKL